VASCGLTGFLGAARARSACRAVAGIVVPLLSGPDGVHAGCVRVEFYAVAIIGEYS
jgi:hypothetical protein